MGMIPSIQDGAIQSQIGTAYDTVKYVADNLPAILEVTAVVENLGSPESNVIIGGVLAKNIKQSVPSVAALRTIAGRYDGDSVDLVSYVAGSNKGSGTLTWRASSVAADDGVRWFSVSGVSTGRWEFISGQILSNMTIKIPSDFPDIQSAIDSISGRVQAVATNINIVIESGHRLTKGCFLANGDFSHITIKSLDPIVYLSSTFAPATALNPPGDINLVFVFDNCKAPIIDILIDSENVPWTGFSFTNGTFLKINPNKGFINGKNGATGSSSTLVARTANLSNNTGVGIWAAAVCQIFASSANCSGCGDIGIFLSRATTGELDSANCTNSLTGIRVSSASTAYAQFANCSGCTTGFDITNAGVANIQNSTADNCQIGIQCSNAGRVSARAAKVRNSVNRGVLSFLGGFVDFANGDSSGASDRFFSVTQGGTIVAVGAIGTPFNPPNVVTANGIIYN